MSDRTKGLLTLLISLFVLGSCTNPSGVGLDVNPEDEIMGALTDTLSLNGVTLLDDSVQSTSISSTFGLFDDPAVGKTQADLAIYLGRPATVPRIRPDAQIDSVVLVIPFGNEYFGDTLNSTFSLQVSQLNEIYVNNAYSTKQWQVKDDVIGTKTLSRFPYKLTDSVTVTKYIDGKDSVVKEVPQLRIPLSGEFFKGLLSNTVDSASLSTEEGFRKHVKGLYLDIDEAASNGIGGLVTFRATPNIAGVLLTFRQPNGKDGEDADTDTIRTFLPAATAGDGYYTSDFYGISSSVKHTYLETVQEQLDNPDSNYEQLFVQAPAGLRTRLRIPHIDSLKGKNIAVNKAELVLYVDDIPVSAFNRHAPRLTLYREDIAGQRQPVPDGDHRNGGDQRTLWGGNGYWQGFGGQLQPVENTKQRYIFRLTSFIQDILLGKINAAEFFIAPASPNDGTIPYFPVLNANSRAVITNTGDPNLRMKLNIYYTQLKD